VLPTLDPTHHAGQESPMHLPYCFNVYFFLILNILRNIFVFLPPRAEWGACF